MQIISLHNSVCTATPSLILTLDFRDVVGHELVEDVVWALEWLLGDDASLLQQVHLDVSTGELAVGGEVDADELTLQEALDGDF